MKAPSDAEYAKLGFTNRFRAPASLLLACRDPRVAAIEGEGCDEGRVFIHLHPGFRFANNGNQPGTRSMTVGNSIDVRHALRIIGAEK